MDIYNLLELEEKRDKRAQDIIKETKMIDELVDKYKTVSNYFKARIAPHKDLMAITDTHSKIEMTYGELEEHISNLASGLQSLGIEKGNHVAIFTENTGRFVVCDQAVMRCGGVCVLRGSNAPIEELEFITHHSDSCAVLLRDKNLFNKAKGFLSQCNLKFVMVMFADEDFDRSGLNCPVYTYDEIREIGKNHNFVEPEMSYSDFSTILYSSGTTGNPKGVLLTHKNVLSQFPSVEEGFQSKPGENTLQILPIWHAYERTAQMYYYLCGCHLHFTTIPKLKDDLVKYPIDTFMSVPRIWEAIRLGVYQKLKQNSKLGYYIFDFAVRISIAYKIHKMYAERRLTNKKTRYKKRGRLYHKIARSFIKPLHILFTKTVYKKLKDAAGLNFRATISGGGAITMKDELFYDAIGVNLRVGYGLTETSPVLTLRGVQDKNYLGSAGKPILATDMKIVDPKTFEPLGIFNKGLVLVKGPQVMAGYYKDEEATKKVMLEDGWFNTGDLGWLTGDNNLVLVGRMKETIVLSNGENVEPVPIEEACLGSPYIDQIVLVGQDESSIGALIVPSQEALEKCEIAAKNIKSGKNLTINNPNLRDLIKHELNKYIKNKPNLKSFEAIKHFEVLKDGFTVDNGMMNNTAKIKRNNVFDKYKDIISKMFTDKNK